MKTSEINSDTLGKQARTGEGCRQDMIHNKSTWLQETNNNADLKFNISRVGCCVDCRLGGGGGVHYKDPSTPTNSTLKFPLKTCSGSTGIDSHMGFLFEGK